VNEQEQEKFEAELRRITPARLPEHFLARLQAARPDAKPAPQKRAQEAAAMPGWQNLLNWLTPALALASVVLFVSRLDFNTESIADKVPLPTMAYGMKADGVRVDQELVSSFDVVAKLPTGEPVRFRCQKWKDELIVTDKSSGIEIEQSSPRVEVVPVRFETY
jgi:hypothetical protein